MRKHGLDDAPDKSTPGGRGCGGGGGLREQRDAMEPGAYGSTLIRLSNDHGTLKFLVPQLAETSCQTEEEAQEEEAEEEQGEGGNEASPPVDCDCDGPGPSKQVESLSPARPSSPPYTIHKFVPKFVMWKNRANKGKTERDRERDREIDRERKRERERERERERDLCRVHWTTCRLGAYGSTLIRLSNDHGTLKFLVPQLAETSCQTEEEAAEEEAEEEQGEGGKEASPPVDCDCDGPGPSKQVESLSPARPSSPPYTIHKFVPKFVMWKNRANKGKTGKECDKKDRKESVAFDPNNNPNCIPNFHIPPEVNKFGNYMQVSFAMAILITHSC
eukprot:sb/3466624/